MLEAGACSVRVLVAAARGAASQREIDEKTAKITLSDIL